MCPLQQPSGARVEGRNANIRDTSRKAAGLWQEKQALGAQQSATGGPFLTSAWPQPLPLWVVAGLVGCRRHGTGRGLIIIETHVMSLRGSLYIFSLLF